MEEEEKDGRRKMMGVRRRRRGAHTRCDRSPFLFPRLEPHKTAIVRS
jgi:hypothetical protein